MREPVVRFPSGNLLCFRRIGRRVPSSSNVVSVPPDRVLPGNQAAQITSRKQPLS